MRDVCPVCHRQDKLRRWHGSLSEPSPSESLALGRPDSGRAGDGLVTAEAWMLASEPDPALPTAPRFLRPRRRSAPSAAEIAFVALAVVLSLGCIFGILTLLAQVWTGWEAASLRSLLLAVLSGFGALACVWLAWRLSAARHAGNGASFGRDDQRAFEGSAQIRSRVSEYLYCERDHIVFESMANQTDPALVEETSAQ